MNSINVRMNTNISSIHIWVHRKYKFWKPQWKLKCESGRLSQDSQSEKRHETWDRRDRKTLILSRSKTVIRTMLMTKRSTAALHSYTSFLARLDFASKSKFNPLHLCDRTSFERGRTRFLDANASMERSVAICGHQTAKCAFQRDSVYSEISRHGCTAEWKDIRLLMKRFPNDVG